MKELMIKNREDKCPECKTERSLELYDIDDHPLRFNYLLDSDNTTRLHDKKCSYFLCRRCKTEFPIDWINPDIPRPLTNTKIDDFLRNYTLR